jgi:hypothetical protein
MGTMQPWAGKLHIAVEGAEYDRVAAFAAPAGTAGLAAALPFRPRRDLGVHKALLNGGRQCLALGK